MVDTTFNALRHVDTVVLASLRREVGASMTGGCAYKSRARDFVKVLECGEVDMGSDSCDVIGAFLQSLPRHTGCDVDDSRDEGHFGANHFDEGGGEGNPPSARDSGGNSFDDGGGTDDFGYEQTGCKNCFDNGGGEDSSPNARDGGREQLHERGGTDDFRYERNCGKNCFGNGGGEDNSPNAQGDGRNSFDDSGGTDDFRYEQNGGKNCFDNGAQSAGQRREQLRRRRRRGRLP